MVGPSLSEASAHRCFAGRLPAGTEYPITTTKQGATHVQQLPTGKEEDVLVVGLACSEIFSGPNLYKILKPGFDYEAKVMAALAEGKGAGPLSIHTSSGVPCQLAELLEELEKHLPWKREGKQLDWCVSLQLEGASAVWAGIDMLLQIGMLENGNRSRIKVAVAAVSYHGPPSTSFGSREPLWHKYHQITYPAPVAGESLCEESLLESYRAFLDEHGGDIGVILFEPQWGSSQAGLPWPKRLLSRYIDLAKECGIKVLCDEIMCGLGRHGQETVFVSEAWNLDPDAVTFGKAMGAGVYPISGAILKHGRDLLQENKQTVMQSHTYAGSSSRALMAATALLRELPTWLQHIARLGVEMEQIFRSLEKSSGELVRCHGQGLMWGGIFSRRGQCAEEGYRNAVVAAFRSNCKTARVLPYFVPVGGFMISPVMDIDEKTVSDIGKRLHEGLTATMKQVGWARPHNA